MPGTSIATLTTDTSPASASWVPITDFTTGVTGKVSLTSLVVNSLGCASVADPYFYNSGWWITGPGATTTGAGTTGTCTVYPFCLSAPVTITAFAVDVTTAATGGLARLGVYNANATTQMPGTLKIDLGTVTTATVAVATITPGTAVAFTPGMYWLAVTPQTAAATFRVFTAPAVYNLPQSSVSTTAALGYTMTGVTGSYPASFTIAAASTAPTQVWLKQQ